MIKKEKKIYILKYQDLNFFKGDIQLKKNVNNLRKEFFSLLLSIVYFVQLVQIWGKKGKLKLKRG